MGTLWGGDGGKKDPPRKGWAGDGGWDKDNGAGVGDMIPDPNPPHCHWIPSQRNYWIVPKYKVCNLIFNFFFSHNHLHL